MSETSFGKGNWLARAQALRERLQAPRLRPWLRGAGLAALLVGAVWSIATLDIRPSSLVPGWLLLNLFILAPLQLIIAGGTLRLTAQVLGRDIPLSETVRVAAAANVAELLPLPGGAIVRGAALMRSGAGMGESAAMITLTALLTLAMTVTLSALALAFLGRPVGWGLALAGVAGGAMTLARLARRAGPKLLVALVAIRLATLAVSVLTLATSFAALGLGASLMQAALYTVATSLGATVAIVPAGFGVNEAIAAGLAAMVAGSPAAAFLAVALNRALGLGAGALLGPVLILWRGMSHR